MLYEVVPKPITMHSGKNAGTNTVEPATSSLTQREIEIMKLMCEEYSNKQIAAKLGISPYTVEDHKKSIRKKTGSFTVAGVAVFAVRNHIYLQVIIFILASLPDGNFFEQV